MRLCLVLAPGRGFQSRTRVRCCWLHLLLVTTQRLTTAILKCVVSTRGMSVMQQVLMRSVFLCAYVLTKNLLRKSRQGAIWASHKLFYVLLFDQFELKFLSFGAFTAMILLRFFRVLAPCSHVGRYRHFGGTKSIPDHSHVNLKNGINAVLRNNRIRVQDYTVSQLRRPRPVTLNSLNDVYFRLKVM